ncbi:hypothetical protein [Sphingomonas sp.]|uniref:hypothetical protein n=1 Tax=Sphingomonas sp. TaxID=28214 RepID=UPI003AFF6AA6
MPQTDRQATAELTWTLHQPFRASVADCLLRWHTLDGPARARSYLVLHGQAGLRRTLDAEHIADLAMTIG